MQPMMLSPASKATTKVTKFTSTKFIKPTLHNGFNTASRRTRSVQSQIRNYYNKIKKSKVVYGGNQTCNPHSDPTASQLH